MKFFYLKNTLSKNAFFYFNPPYYIKGKDLYLNHYIDKDHVEIANEISNLKIQKWIVTYDDVIPIKKLYSDYRQKQFSLNYSAGNRCKKGQEVMIFSDNIYITKHNLFKQLNFLGTRSTNYIDLVEVENETYLFRNVMQK